MELKDEHYKFYGEKSLRNRIKNWQQYGKYGSFSAALRDLVLVGLNQLEPLMKDGIKIPMDSAAEGKEN